MYKLAISFVASILIIVIGNFGQVLAQSNATLALKPSSATIKTGETLDLEVILNTGGAATDGTDIIINYNPASLEIVDQNTSQAGVQIKAGNLYPTYLGNLVDIAKGTIKLSGIIQPGDNGYSGSGTFATITVKGLSIASGVNMNFDFSRGDTTDSNVVEHGTSQDILASVTNGSYIVSSSNGTGPGPNPNPPNPPSSGIPSTGDTGGGISDFVSGAISSGMAFPIALLIIFLILATLTLFLILKRRQMQ